MRNGIALAFVFIMAACVGSESNNPSGGNNADTIAPVCPTGLLATATTSSSIALNWTASTDNVGVAGYKIYRNGSQTNTATTNAFNDAGLSSSTTYTYTVSAYDAAGNNSTQSTAAVATTTADSVGCTTDASCGLGKMCVAGSCITNPNYCTSNSSCGLGKMCVAGSCITNPNYCTSNSSCGLGKKCVAGSCIIDPNQCVPACISPKHCTAGICL
jgi:hypothetical protein